MVGAAAPWAQLSLAVRPLSDSEGVEFSEGKVICREPALRPSLLRSRCRGT
jgi:hypothetical protein